MVKLNLVFLLLLLIQGCATQPQILSPSQNFLTSETQGETLKGQFIISHLPGASVNVKIEETSTEEELDTKEFNNQFGASLQTGVIRNVDFFTRVQIFSPIIYGLKIQLLGMPKTEAEYQGHSLSLFMGLGRHRYYDNQGNNLTQQTNGDYEFNRSHNVTEYGLAYGYRLYSDILAYGRYTIVKQSVIGDIDYDKNTNIDGERIEVKGDHRHYSAGIVWYTKKINIGSEFTFSQYNYEGDQLTMNSLNLIIGRDF